MAAANPKGEGWIARGVAFGILLTIGGWAGIVVVGQFAAPDFLFTFAVAPYLVGIVQVVWMLPAILFFTWRGERRTVLGLVGVAVAIAVWSAYLFSRPERRASRRDVQFAADKAERPHNAKSAGARPSARLAGGAPSSSTPHDAG